MERSQRGESDFNFGKDIFLEVKTCAQKEQGPSVMKSNWMTMVYPSCSLCLCKVENSGVTLNHIISEMRTKILVKLTK